LTGFNTINLIRFFDRLIVVYFFESPDNVGVVLFYIVIVEQYIHDHILLDNISTSLIALLYVRLLL